MNTTNDGVIRDALAYVPGNGGYIFWDTAGMLFSVYNWDWDISDLRHPKVVFPDRIWESWIDKGKNAGNQRKAWNLVLKQFQWQAKQDFLDWKITMKPRDFGPHQYRTWSDNVAWFREDWVKRHGTQFYKIKLLDALIDAGKANELENFEYEAEPWS